ncbi:uncharacterized protein LOC127005250 isoform X2 [Eriocheir sinensis]|nr:uncharacterized protein LOC127005250 isoform X2 [Eriocheir sinensis]
MGHIDTRAASLYSSLLTSTLAMCHYLEAQTWRKSTAQAVNSLKETSHQVSSQLELAHASAASLRMQMEKQLTESRDALTSAFKDIRESAEEQRSLVEGVFLRVGQLHSLVMGEFSGINAVAFYMVGVIMSLLVTCGTRTGSVRLPLFLLLTATFAVERFIAYLILNFWDSYSPQEDIQSAAHVVRCLAATFGTLLVVYSALCFRDPWAAAVAQLEEVMQATQELKKLFGFGGGGNQAFELLVPGSLMEVFEYSDSSDDTYGLYDSDDDIYDPNDDSDLEECLAMLNNHPPPMCKTRKTYSLRPRKPSSPNPILAIESPTAFSVLVERKWSLRRRIARFTRSPANFKLQQESDQEEAGVVQ